MSGISFDRIADRFDATRGYPDSVMEDIMTTLSSVLPAKGLILDAGVGTGRFAAPLQERGFEVVGLDLSGKMLTKAREKGVGNIVRGDLCATPFRENAFKMAMSVHVLHLIPKWKCALGEIARVTTDTFLSVAFYKVDSPAEEIRDFYDQTCTELGFTVHHPGLRERELPDLVPPDSETIITTHEHPVNVAQMISDYESRTFSSQWFVPEEIHVEAIEKMRERFGSLDEVIGRERISLLQWDMAKIRAYLAGLGPE